MHARKKQKVCHHSIIKKKNNTITEPEAHMEFMMLPNELIYDILVSKLCFYGTEEDDQSDRWNHPSTERHLPYCATHVAVVMSVCKQWRLLILGVLAQKNYAIVGSTVAAPNWYTIPNPDPIEVVAMECAFYGYTGYLKNIAKKTRKLFSHARFAENICAGRQLDTLKALLSASLDWSMSTTNVRAIAEASVLRHDYTELFKWLYEFYVEGGIKEGYKPSSRLHFKTLISVHLMQRALHRGNVAVAKFIFEKNKEALRPQEINTYDGLTNAIGSGSMEAFRYMRSVHGPVDPKHFCDVVRTAFVSKSLPMLWEVLVFIGPIEQSLEALIYQPTNPGFCGRVMGLCDMPMLRYLHEHIPNLLTIKDKLEVLLSAVSRGNVETIDYVARTVLDMTPTCEHLRSKVVEDEEILMNRGEFQYIDDDVFIEKLWSAAFRRRSMDVLRAVLDLPYKFELTCDMLIEAMGRSTMISMGLPNGAFGLEYRTKYKYENPTSFTYPIPMSMGTWCIGHVKEMEAEQPIVRHGNAMIDALLRRDKLHQLYMFLIREYTVEGDLKAIKSLVANMDEKYLGKYSTFDDAIPLAFYSNQTDTLEYIIDTVIANSVNPVSTWNAIEEGMRNALRGAPECLSDKILTYITPKTVRWAASRGFNIHGMLYNGKYVESMHPIMRFCFSDLLLNPINRAIPVERVYLSGKETGRMKEFKAQSQ